MSDGSGQFLPYHKWFGIPPNELPANAYRLLGISPYEPDDDVIANAVQQRLGFVSQFLHGEHAETARAIMDELKQIEQSLLNPESKAVYDQQLRGSELARLTHATHQAIVSDRHGTAGRVQPSSNAVPPRIPSSTGKPPVLIPLGTPGARTPGPRVQRKPKSAFVEFTKIVIGGIVGIGISLAIVMVIRSSRQDSVPTMVDGDAEQTAAKATSDEIRAPEAGQLPSQLLTAESPDLASVDAEPPASERAPTTLEVKHPRDVDALDDGPASVEVDPFKTLDQPDQQPVVRASFNLPTTTAKPSPKPTEAANLFAQMPSTVSLPTLLTRQPLPILQFAADPAETVGLELINIAAKLSDNDAFQLVKHEDPSVLQWNVVIIDVQPQADREPTPIAVFSLAKQQLMFHWFEQAVGTAARQLRNCLLRLTVGPRVHEVTLREAIMSQPIKIDLDQRVINHAVPVEQMPDVGLLQFEITAFNNFPPQTAFKGSRQTADVSGEIVLEIPQYGGAYLRIKTARRSDDELSLLVYPMYKLNAAEQFDLTTTRLASIESGTSRSLASAERDLAEKVAELQALERQYSAVASTTASNGAAALVKKQQLEAIASRAKICNRRIASLQQQIPDMRARLAALPRLQELVSLLHNKAELHVRVFAVAEGREIQLFQAG